MSDELDELALEGDDYLEPVDVVELVRAVTAGVILASMMVEVLEQCGIAPAACRALRMVVPRVDFVQVSRVDGGG